MKDDGTTNGGTTMGKANSLGVTTTDVTKLGVRVERADGCYRLTDHLGNVYEARQFGDDDRAPRFGLKLVKSGKFPGFGPRDTLVMRNGVLCLVGR